MKLQRSGNAEGIAFVLHLFVKEQLNS